MKRVEHGMIAMPPSTGRKLEAQYAIHSSNALIARRAFNIEVAREHARQSRALVREFARFRPFSAETGRLYLRGGQ